MTELVESGGSALRDRLNRGGQGHSDRPEDCSSGSASLGPQAEGLAPMTDVDFLESIEIPKHAGPFDGLDLSFGLLVLEPLESDHELLAQQESQEGAEDVSADALVGLVEDRSRGQDGLRGPEDVFCRATVQD